MGGMYEFIPQESAQQTDNPNPPDVCHTGEVEVGKNYELVSTMRSGMYRYRSGDILRIEEISDDGVPAVRMQYRLGMLSNLFGEKIFSGWNHILNMQIDRSPTKKVKNMFLFFFCLFVI